MCRTVDELWQLLEEIRGLSAIAQRWYRYVTMMTQSLIRKRLARGQTIPMKAAPVMAGALTRVHELVLSAQAEPWVEMPNRLLAAIDVVLGSRGAAFATAPRGYGDELFRCLFKTDGSILDTETTALVTRRLIAHGLVPSPGLVHEWPDSWQRARLEVAATERRESVDSPPSSPDPTILEVKKLMLCELQRALYGDATCPEGFLGGYVSLRPWFGY